MWTRFNEFCALICLSQARCISLCSNGHQPSRLLSKLLSTGLPPRFPSELCFPASWRVACSAQRLSVSKQCCNDAHCTIVVGAVHAISLLFLQMPKCSTLNLTSLFLRRSAVPQREGRDEHCCYDSSCCDIYGSRCCHW